MEHNRHQQSGFGVPAPSSSSFQTIPPNALQPQEQPGQTQANDSLSQGSYKLIDDGKKFTDTEYQYLANLLYEMNPGYWHRNLAYKGFWDDLQRQAQADLRRYNIHYARSARAIQKATYKRKFYYGEELLDDIARGKPSQVEWDEDPIWIRGRLAHEIIPGDLPQVTSVSSAQPAPPKIPAPAPQAQAEWHTNYGHLRQPTYTPDQTPGNSPWVTGGPAQPAASESLAFALRWQGGPDENYGRIDECQPTHPPERTPGHSPWATGGPPRIASPDFLAIARRSQGKRKRDTNYGRINERQPTYTPQRTPGHSPWATGAPPALPAPPAQIPALAPQAQAERDPQNAHTDGLRPLAQQDLLSIGSWPGMDAEAGGRPYPGTQEFYNYYGRWE